LFYIIPLLAPDINGPSFLTMDAATAPFSFSQLYPISSKIVCIVCFAKCAETVANRGVGAALLD